MNFSRVNAGHVAGQAVLIADQRRKNGFEVSERETGHLLCRIGWVYGGVKE